MLFLMTIMLCGCTTTQNETDEPQTTTVYQDGTYTATAMGYGGEFQVEVVLKDDKIEDIVVNEHYETPSIGGVAIEQMIEKMITENSYDVDTISGATRTSEALKDAVETAMGKARNQTE